MSPNSKKSILLHCTQTHCRVQDFLHPGRYVFLVEKPEYQETVKKDEKKIENPFEPQKPLGIPISGEQKPAETAQERAVEARGKYLEGNTVCLKPGWQTRNIKLVTLFPHAFPDGKVISVKSSINGRTETATFNGTDWVNEQGIHVPIFNGDILSFNPAPKKPLQSEAHNAPARKNRPAEWKAVSNWRTVADLATTKLREWIGEKPVGYEEICVDPKSGKEYLLKVEPHRVKGATGYKKETFEGARDRGFPKNEAGKTYLYAVEVYERSGEKPPQANA